LGVLWIRRSKVRILPRQPATDATGLPIRVDLHTGEIEFVGDDVRGVAVHAAERVMSLAEAGEVLVSSTTADALEDAGAHDMKGLSRRRQLYRLTGVWE
jgi:class 3 adenylate cyclase